MEYFGTNLDMCGHCFYKLKDDGMRYSKTDFGDIPFDPEILTEQATRKGECYFYQIDGYSIIAIEGSCTDARWGTHSVFFIRESLSKDEMIERIKSIPIAMRIINQMPFKVEILELYETK